MATHVCDADFALLEAADFLGAQKSSDGCDSPNFCLKIGQTGFFSHFQWESKVAGLRNTELKDSLKSGFVGCTFSSCSIKPVPKFCNLDAPHGGE